MLLQEHYYLAVVYRQFNMNRIPMMLLGYIQYRMIMLVIIMHMYQDRFQDDYTIMTECGMMSRQR